ncbi:hypothetical protein GOQ27_03145 [Clostridium sp. D2Q-11]|uniref:Sporulation membrane protein YtrI C-terminal domain-containing protein n=1 Tax=Anaeromonas frigoriresistens TaxID=2683708 RepID=A0A942Z5H5_9FIRM|nr:hypothetical protein [Anaeromonas frigoriresistens]MBS4537441.1 hypothetical protein [Anaeromonas frigoriresistens]
MDRVKGINKFFITLIMGMIIGMIIGSLTVTIFVSYKIDEYYQRLNVYYTLLEEKDLKLNKLEESINKNRYILKDINIKLENINDEIDEIELIKHIKEKYINLIGKEVKDIDINIISEIVDNRIMKFEENSYKLQVKKVLLSDILEIYIEVKDMK